LAKYKSDEAETLKKTGQGTVHLVEVDPKYLLPEDLAAYEKYYLKVADLLRQMDKIGYDGVVEELEREPEFADELLKLGEEFMQEHRNINIELGHVGKGDLEKISRRDMWAFLANKIGLVYGAAQHATMIQPK
jgi:hypothetical protein